MTDLNRLKVLAERALDCTFDSYVALLASAKPQEILGLIDEVERLRTDAARYRWLRERDLETISRGGVFAGMTPENIVLNLEDLDAEIDAAIEGATKR